MDLEAGYDALDLSPWDGLPDALTSRALYRADALTRRAVARHAARIARALGDLDALPDSPTRTMLRRQLERADDGDGPLPEEPALAPTLALLDHVARHYPAVLRGELDGARVLTSREALAIWQDYFSPDHLAYHAVNLLGAEAASRVDGDRLSVLEVGAGLGSGTRALLERLGDRVARLTMTDRAPILLRRGVDAVRDAFPDAFPDAPLEHARLDIDAPSLADGPRVDLVFGVNVLHAARDLRGTLSALRSRCRTLVIAEGVRPRRGAVAPIELAFAVDPRFGDVVVEPWRQGGGFLAVQDWPLALRAAGFDDVTILPDPAAVAATYPDYTLAAIVAR